jgi:hypothetical protein
VQGTGDRGQGAGCRGQVHGDALLLSTMSTMSTMSTPFSNKDLFLTTKKHEKARKFAGVVISFGFQGIYFAARNLREKIWRIQNE